MKKTIIYLVLILISIALVQASPNDPVAFGNLTDTTVLVGGSQGIVNATGMIDSDIGFCIAGVCTYSWASDVNMSAIVASIGNWSEDKSSYQPLISTQTCLGAQVFNSYAGGIFSCISVNGSGEGSGNITGVDNIFLFEVTGIVYWNVTKGQIYNDTSYINTRISSMSNLTDDDIVLAVGNWTNDKADYATIIYTDNVIASIGNWTNDKADYATIVYVDGRISSLINLTEEDVVIAVGNWSEDKPSYSTIAYVDGKFVGLNNLSYSDIVASIGNWSADKDSYATITYVDGVNTTDNIAGLGFPLSSSLANVTIQEINDSFGNWSQDKSLYATIVYVDGKFVGLNNLSYSDIINSIGNWSLDRSLYATIAYANGVNASARAYTNSVVGGINNLSMRQINNSNGNWSLDRGSYATIVYANGVNASARAYANGINTTSNIIGLGFPLAASLPNVTMQQINNSFGNWSQAQSLYATLVYVDTRFTSMNNLSTADIVTAVGNWTLDKPAYQTRADTAINLSTKFNITGGTVTGNTNFTANVSVQGLAIEKINTTHWFIGVK